MKTAYLDYNIFTAIEDGELSIESILSNVDRSIIAFPFSAGHIQEVDNIKGKTERERKKFIDKRLNTIRQISDRIYLYQELPTNEVHWLKEDPEQVLETITQVPFGKTAMKMFTNLFTAEQKDEFRQNLGVDPKLLNNYSPQQVVGHLNTKLTNWGTQDTFIEMIEKSISFHPNGKSFGLNNRIAGAMELLDMLGYWKDRETENSNYARLWDSNHTFFASHCDFFISNDKKTRYKARVIYDIYGINTKVISSEGKE